MNVSSAPRPIYFDTDLGIDDALALGVLLRHPASNLVGVGSVHGNTSAAQAAENTIRLLALAGRAEVPVAVGETGPLMPRELEAPSHVHGDNGIGGVELPAAEIGPIAESSAELLVRLARQHPGALRVVAVGPLTNLARALELEPELPRLVESVYVMGGNALAPGNITPAAEANVFHDPDAAAAVFDAGWPVVLAPLDVTMYHRFSAADREALAASADPATRAIAAMLETYFDFYSPILGEQAIVLHDPLAAALAVGLVEPALARRVRVVVDTTEGPGRGQTIADLRGIHRDVREVEGATVTIVFELDRGLAGPLRELLIS